MKTQILKAIIVIAALAITVANAADVRAESRSGLIFNSRAYTHGTQTYPNPEADRFFKNAEIIYVNAGYGPAVYSYPRSVPDQQIAMNVEFISQAYGPAIYSYPYNNPQPANTWYLKISALITPEFSTLVDYS